MLAGAHKKEGRTGLKLDHPDLDLYQDTWVKVSFWLRGYHGILRQIVCFLAWILEFKRGRPFLALGIFVSLNHRQSAMKSSALNHIKRKGDDPRLCLERAFSLTIDYLVPEAACKSHQMVESQLTLGFS